MYEIVHIREDLFLFQYGGDSWPTSSNIYAIPDKDGLNIIDTGLNREESFGGLRLCIHELGFSISDIHTILLTHGHTDHIAGANFLSLHCTPRILLSEKSIPEAIHPSMQEHYCLPSRVREISARLRNYDILNNFQNTCGPWTLDTRQITAVRDDDEIEMGNYAFQAMHVPGHDVGLMVFYEPKTKILLTTDLLKASRPGNALPWYSSSAGGPSNYLKSLGKVTKLNVREAFPSHGSLRGVFTDMVRRTKDVILDREARIIASLKEGPKTLDQLDSILFSPAVLKLCPWFSCVTESHLLELEHDGVVEQDGLDFVATRSC